MVSRAVHAYPQATALLWRGVAMSYRELERRANRLAHYLLAIGLPHQGRVAVRIEPGFDTAITLLATLKAGGVHLPIDAGMPLARAQAMLDDAQAALLLTPDAWAGELVRAGTRTVCLQAEDRWIAREPYHAPMVPLQPDDLAYLLYTSGTSGAPKGVAVGQRELAAKMSLHGAWGAVSRSTCTALTGSPGFDATLGQLLWPLTHGGCVVLLDLEDRLVASRLWHRLAAAQVTLLDGTPSWLAAVLPPASDAECPEPGAVPLARIVLGGEALPTALARRIRATWPDVRIVNAYGPTEACIDATAHELTHADLVADSVPIGHALPGYHVSLRDPQGSAVATGAVGEICIGGLLAQRYWQRPDETAARFITTPAGERVYRTGDRGRMDDGGTLMFLGRDDGQIKIRGQRIELDEIAAVLHRHPDVAAAAVVFDGNAAGGGGLAAFVVPRAAADTGDPAALIAALRQHAQAHLPGAMLPSRWALLDALPLTANGKLDRASLRPSPADPAGSADCADSTDSADSTEAAIATLWGEALGIAPPAPDANFFELGGHSLLSARVLAAVNTRFGVALPLASFFAHATPADLARAVDRQLRGKDLSRIVHLGRPGPWPKLFCVPPLSGMGTVYAGLGRLLAGRAQLCALQATGLARTPPGSLDLEALAAVFVADLCAEQAHGPIHLCGYSAGGAIALEMCRQLAAAGRRVASLVLLDPYCHEPDATRSSNEASYWDAVRDLVGDMGIGDAAADPILAVARRLWQALWKSRDRDAARVSALLAETNEVLGRVMPAELFVMMLEGTRNVWAAYCGHRPTPLEALPPAIWMLQPDADTDAFRAERLRRWRALTGPGLRVALIPGEHASMLKRSRSLEALAEAIATAVTEVTIEEPASETTP